jgi:DNA-binding SARP family transcriptional activator/Tfp pilus assembly protein PilF
MPAEPPGPLVGRFTVVHAAAGYGKTTAVRTWLRNTPVRWLRGADLADGEPVVATGRQVTVVDDLHLAPGPVAMPTVTGDARLVVISRDPPPAALCPPDAIRAEIGPARLALTPARTARLLRHRYGIGGAELAERVHRLTAGWPALAHLAGMSLAADPEPAAAASDAGLLGVLVAPGTAAADYLSTEVVDGLPDPARRLLADAAHLESISVELADALGHRRPAPTIARLARLGLFDPPVPGTGWYRVVPLVAAFAREALPRSAVRRRRVLDTAAGWHRRHRRPADALRLALAVGDHAAGADLLAGSGPELLGSGAAADVVTAVRGLPAGLRDGGTDLLLAEALEMTGDTGAALEVYTALGGGSGPLPPGLAWRHGLALYMWGDPRQALCVLRRGAVTGADTADEALLLGWTAAAYWLAGDVHACADHADRAYRAARAAADDRALANAHVALALSANLAGDPAALQTHYGRALPLAESVGDVVLVTRIRANLAASLERQGRYADALEILRPAVTLAERTAHAGMRAMALCNEAALLRRVGRFDEAAGTFARSIETYQRMGCRKVAYPLAGLADLHRERGRRSEARACYEEAVKAASDDANRQALVPALAGLARVVADDEPALAADLVTRALAHAVGSQVTVALLAAGWTALRAGDRPAARRRALAAAGAAGRHRDRPGLAEALELRAAAATGSDEARQALAEALAIWRDTAAGLDSDRVIAALGALAGACDEQKLDARLAADRLRSAGVVVLAPPARHDDDAPADVEIRALGRFAVLLGGVPAPGLAWQSRKARDLLRILVARRGRPVPRDELTAVLWRCDAGDGDRVSHRLSVALSTVRGVLDPRRVAPADHVLAADQATIRLNLDHVAVDVETFLGTAQHGLRLAARGDDVPAHAALAEAERLFTGEVYADEPYDDWARPLREEVHATYLHVVRVLVGLARRSGGYDDAVRYLLRILAIDQYDERSHRDLVTVLIDAGRYGEAWRCHARYVEAMRDIGVVAEPVPGLPPKRPAAGPAAGTAVVATGRFDRGLTPA